MAVKTVIGEDAIGTEAFQNDYQFEPSTADFVENDSAESQQQAAPNVEDPYVAERKRKIKSDVFTLLGTAIINAAPLLIDAIKHHKDPVPHKVDKGQVAKLGVSLVVPAIQAFDTIVLGSKIQNTIEEKTPFKLSDVRNVVNVIQAYPSTKTTLTNYMMNVSRQANGKQQIAQNPAIKTAAYTACVNVVAPYVIDKFCDNNLTFVEKCSSVIPIKIFGGLFKKFMSTDAKLQQAYNVGTSLIQVASYGNKNLSSAVRSNNGRPSGAANSFGTFLDIAQDLVGMNRGNVSRYNDGYDGWNRGSSFNSL